MQEKDSSCPRTQGLVAAVCVVLAVVVAHMNGELAASVVSGVS